jgi:rod shape-determining protein MreC
MIILVIVSVALMTIDHRWNSLQIVRSTLSTVLYPLQYTIDLPIRLFFWADEVLTTHQTLLEKNRQYEARHLENRVQLQKLDIIERENERLRKLLSAKPKTTERLLIAEIINVDVDPYRHLVVINKGSQHDVYPGQPIIDARGIMGQIVDVSLVTSTAMLITDVSHAIPVRVNRTGLRAIANGTGTLDRLKIPHLPHNVDIEVGDLLVSSGLGGVFPANYPVAVISKVERPIGETFALIEATPNAELDRSREVLLLWMEQPEVEEQPLTAKTTDAETATEVSKDTPDGEENVSDEQRGDRE